MNNSQPHSKVGLLDMEINQLTKVLFAAVVGLAFIMMLLKGFSGPWYRYWFRFVLLFSYIIPISLRVNLDMGKSYYSWAIGRDPAMAGTAVRCTTIPEELGRISYLLTDKTGTLTQNTMVLKRLHLGTVSYTPDSFEMVKTKLIGAFNHSDSVLTPAKLRKSENTRIRDAVQALALCHNVTPIFETDDSTETGSVVSDTEADQHIHQEQRECTYQVFKQKNNQISCNGANLTYFIGF